MGKEGIELFLHFHECNILCKKLGLPDCGGKLLSSGLELGTHPGPLRCLQCFMKKGEEKDESCYYHPRPSVKRMKMLALLAKLRGDENEAQMVAAACKCGDSSKGCQRASAHVWVSFRLVA